MKAIKGAFNNKNSKFGVFNNWSSERYAQNSDTLFPKLCFGPSSEWLKNLDWNNIHMKAIKGAYNNKNSKFGVFNIWSSERYAQNSDTLFPKL